MPNDDSDEMLAAILKLEDGKSSQEIVTEFHNMRKCAYESTD